MYLLDTDILSDIQRSYAPALAWFASLIDLPSVPGFVVMELIQDAQNAQQVRQALRLVAPLPVVWPMEADCARALSDFTAYHLSHSLGLIDAMIAACAVGRSATLCTFNVKHYRILPGLVMEQPYTRARASEHSSGNPKQNKLHKIYLTPCNCRLTTTDSKPFSILYQKTQ